MQNKIIHFTSTVIAKTINNCPCFHSHTLSINHYKNVCQFREAKLGSQRAPAQWTLVEQVLNCENMSNSVYCKIFVEIFLGVTTNACSWQSELHACPQSHCTQRPIASHTVTVLCAIELGTSQATMRAVRGGHEKAGWTPPSQWEIYSRRETTSLMAVPAGGRSQDLRWIQYRDKDKR